VTELAKEGWDLTAITGADSFDLATATASIVLDPGENVTVVFTNTQTP
jgi:hypothetical protein